MGVIPERKEYKNFTYERYISLSEKSSTLGFKKVTHTPYSEKSHFDKTGLIYDNKKVVLVYDVKAKMLTVTAQEKAIKRLSTLIDSKKEEVKKSDKKADFRQEKQDKQQNKKDKKGKEKKKDSLLDTNLKKDKKDKKNQSEKQEKAKAKEQAKQNKKDKKKLAKEKSYHNSNEQKATREKPVSIDKKVEQQKGRNGTYSVIKDYYPLSFARAMHKIRNDENVKINTLRTGAKIDNRYLIMIGDKQCEIVYLQDEGTLDISGVGTDLVKGKFLEEGGVEVYASHLQAKEDDYVIVLKNKMPSALSFLSAEQKNDLASGMRELEKAVDHYEYSMFLLSPFKGLENFIFDLLKSKNITVKMIGQAFDKNDKGAYILKDAYKNKCGIVYSEVMASLYEEYFATRNYYAHADVNGSHNIGSKKDAIAVVNRIYKNIEYNCKKLTEINFKIIR